MAAHVHHYTARCAWEGSTGVGYEAYDRNHQASVPPAEVELALSSDPAFRGDRDRANPEQLFVLAASSCQLLEFLALAARARIDVVAYRDEAEGVMPEDERPTRITRIDLRPEITVRGDVTDERLAHLVELAHNECYIASSVTTDIRVHPTFVRVS
jgi:organic hydroperoxide reductase OsmC/OhrA